MNYAGRPLPQDRGHLLWDGEKPTELLIESIDRWVDNLLRDDSVASIPNGGTKVEARIISKQNGVLAGVAVIERMLSNSDSKIEIDWKSRDGNRIEPGTIAILNGSSEALLSLERTMLNMLGRLSGIATNTAVWIQSTSCAVACTRKTTWGLLDKWAVILGGGLTHRLSRDDALMLKENDLVGEDSIESALAKVNPQEWGFVEIEVRSQEEALRAANTWIHPQSLVIMLDNMSAEECISTRNSIRDPRIILEVSGGITLDSLMDWRGVDVISASALNQGVPHLDLSLLFEGVE